jgi:mRNA interferase HigB
MPAEPPVKRVVAFVDGQNLFYAAKKAFGYGSASIVGAERVVFNIKGNDYRLVTAIDYRRGIVFIKWLGAHKDYDKIDARTVQYDDQTYPDKSRP